MDLNNHSLFAGYISNVPNFKILGGNLLLKVCVDISYQAKAIEVAQICFEEAAITDTWPAWCCVPSWYTSLRWIVESIPEHQLILVYLSIDCLHKQTLDTF